MKHSVNFIIASSSTFILLTGEAIKDIPPNIFELLKIVISLFGGILTTYLMNLLKSHFEKVGNSKKLVEVLEDNCTLKDTIRQHERTIKDMQKESNNPDKVK